MARDRKYLCIRLAPERDGLFLWDLLSINKSLKLSCNGSIATIESTADA